MVDDKNIIENKETKVCSKCGRTLPIDRFTNKVYWCKNCSSFYTSEIKGRAKQDDIIKFERLYKELVPERILDAQKANIKIIADDEIFLKLINYKNAWSSNYGRILEYNNGKYMFKRIKDNEIGEKICTLKKNVYNGKKWIWQKSTIEVWRLVVDGFVVNYDIVGNTHCWHKDNNKADNYYKNIYPMNDKQYNEVLKRYKDGIMITDEDVSNIINNILYKSDDWYANKWRKSMYNIGYLGCNDSPATNDNYIYRKWANMMQRCYDEEVHKAKPYYASCTVGVEWHNFSNYREWHRKNAMGDRKLDLDKDLLVCGNTVYSSETCTLISHFANTIFEDRSLKNQITLNNSTQKYDVTMIILGKVEKVGTFDTQEDAKRAFIDYKQNYIRDFAEKCKGKVPNKTYEAMMNWKVEMAD